MVKTLLNTKSSKSSLKKILKSTPDNDRKLFRSAFIIKTALIFALQFVLGVISELYHPFPNFGISFKPLFRLGFSFISITFSVGSF